MKQVMTRKQEQAFRRMLVLVAHELTQIANSQKLPDQWDVNEGWTSYTIDAKEAVYAAMAKDGSVPK